MPLEEGEVYGIRSVLQYLQLLSVFSSFFLTVLLLV